MPPITQNTESKPGPSPVYPAKSECWSCGQMVPGDPTAALRRCPDCDVTWKAQILPTRPRAAVEQGSQTTYGDPGRPDERVHPALADAGARRRLEN